MRSLRTRLVTWYVSVGAIIVVCIGLLAAIATVEAVSFQARQALAQSAREAPGLVETYRASHHNLAGVDDFLRRRFAARGVTAHVMAPNTFITFDPRKMRAGLATFPGPPPPQGVPGPQVLSEKGGVLLARPPKGAVGFLTFGRRDERTRPPFFVGLLSMAIKPVTASFKGGDVIMFADPRSFKQLFTILGIFMLVLAAVVLPASWRIAVTVAQNTLEPLLRTTRALNRFGNGDFTPEAVKTNDRSELGELAHAYNRAVAQITRAFEERTKAEGEMRQFVADAGHQLRTPLTVIMGYLSGMAHRAQPLAPAETYATMLAQARRMKTLIDDLITLARLEHPNGSVVQIVDLNEACANVPASFDNTGRARISVRLSDAPAYVEGDETDIAGALCALVDNALKYAPQSPVEVVVKAEGRYWTVSVSDRGPGMSRGDLRKAYDRFYRGSAAEGTEGTGLGLPIVRKSIERAGGTVSLQNREGGGLLCAITLPAAEDAPIAAAAQ